MTLQWEWSVVTTVRMDKQGTKAYALAFKKTFQKMQGRPSRV